MTFDCFAYDGFFEHDDEIVIGMKHRQTCSQKLLQLEEKNKNKILFLKRFSAACLGSVHE